MSWTVDERVYIVCSLTNQILKSVYLRVPKCVCLCVCIPVNMAFRGLGFNHKVRTFWPILTFPHIFFIVFKVEDLTLEARSELRLG